MESFSLLKYWRASSSRADVASSSSSTTTIATSAAAEPNIAGGEEEEEDGSFFDLEFSEKNSVSVSESNAEAEEGDRNAEEEKEIGFAVSSPSSDQSVSASSDDLFFKGTLLPDLETSSASDPKAVFPISLLKSATKFRVFTKKPRSGTDTDTPADSPKKSSLFIRFISADEVPIVSLFSGSRNSNKNKPDQQVDQENKFLVHKYIDKIKPLYVRVSKKYGDKLGFSGQLTGGNTDSVAGGDRTARVAASGFRVVMNRLGKNKSSSSAVAAVPSPPPVTAKRMDEEDGIQSAIAHCKRSFNSSPKVAEPQSQRSERDGGENIT